MPVSQDVKIEVLVWDLFEDLTKNDDTILLKSIKNKMGLRGFKLSLDQVAKVLEAKDDFVKYWKIGMKSIERRTVPLEGDEHAIFSLILLIRGCQA